MNQNNFLMLPLNILGNNKISPNAKIIFGYISNLSKNKGYCFATNSYFAEELNLNKKTVSRLINNLIKAGLIKAETVINENSSYSNQSQRRLYVNDSENPVNNNTDTPTQNCGHSLSNKEDTLIQNCGHSLSNKEDTLTQNCGYPIHNTEAHIRITKNRNLEEKGKELNLPQKNFLRDIEISKNSSSENLDFLEKEISSEQKLPLPEVEIEFSFYENEIEQFKNDFSFSGQEILDLIEKSKKTVRTQNTKFDSRADLRKYMQTKFQLAQDMLDKKLHQEKFDEWWVLYDKKTQKPKALELWKKIKPELVPEILAHTAEYVKSTPEKQYRQAPDKYLRNECWNDEIIYHKSNKFNQNQGVNQNGTSLGINQKYPNLQIRSVSDLRATLTVAEIEASRQHLRETGY